MVRKALMNRDKIKETKEENNISVALIVIKPKMKYTKPLTNEDSLTNNDMTNPDTNNNKDDTYFNKGKAAKVNVTAHTRNNNKKTKDCESHPNK